MSGIREISERKANALNFLNPVSQPMRGLDFRLLTNGKPLFQVLRFRIRFKTLCDSTHFIIIQAFLESFLEIAVWLWKLQSDCGYCTMIAEIAVWSRRLQCGCGDYSLIAEIAVCNSALNAWDTLECRHLGVIHGKI